MRQLIIPAEFQRDDFCTKCNNRSIEVYNYFGKPLGFSNLVDSRLTSNLLSPMFDRMQICSMVCRRCGQKYYIDWTDGYPRPLREQNLLLKKFRLLFIDEKENKK